MLSGFKIGGFCEGLWELGYREYAHGMGMDVVDVIDGLLL